MVQEAADRAISSGYATNGSPNRQRIPAAQAMPYLPPTRTFVTPCRTKAGVTPCVSLVDRPTGASSGPVWLPVDELGRNAFVLHGAEHWTLSWSQDM